MIRRTLKVAIACASLAGPVAAQGPTLRLEIGSASQIVHGSGSGVATYPLRTMERLGAVVEAESPTYARATLYGDTLEFWPTSSFFRVAGALQTLVTPVEYRDGSVGLPEQFFIEWLPQRYGASLTWSGGALRQATQVADNGGPDRAEHADGTASSNGASGNGGSSSAGATGGADPVRSAGAGSSDDTDADGLARIPGLPARPIVVIDPGHGGRDRGKTGPNGLHEKDVVLDISKRLASFLEGRGYDTYLTRDNDTLIALADRPHLANEARGSRPAIFLSIHANSFTSSSVRGFETFFLSDARTEDERRVAEMENAAVAFEDEPTQTRGEVGAILDDMRNDFYVRASSDLAETVQHGISTFHSGPNRGVKRAGFEVLVGALMPAVLVEVAFISNPQEARLLASDEFKDTLITNMADSVDRFFQRNAYLWAVGDAGGGRR